MFQETTDKTLSSCIRENEKLTKESCNRLLVKLKRKHLDPLLARLRAAGGCKLSFDDLVQGYKRVEEEYHSDAKGAQDVCATVFFEFYPVRYYLPHSFIQMHSSYKLVSSS